MENVVDLSAAVAAVAIAIVAVAGAGAVAVKAWRWAYAETHRRHRLDRIAALEPVLKQVAYQLSPNHGESVFDRITHLTTEAFPELVGRVVNVEGYVNELKEREQRGTSMQTVREPHHTKEQP